ncbi:MAG: MFS transporter [Desulfobulbaceae bacterium]|jgi:FSR family fosmidomycin resistance protein-like MFS transporter|nr:MFS transporter [Desulfobulbaceae bacterium]
MSTNLKVLFALTLAHFSGDFYCSYVNPLFPLFVDKLHLTLAEVGIIAGTMRMLAFIVQPCVGYLADRYQSRVFIFSGVLFAVCFIPMSGLANGFWPLLCAVALGSIGSSMFHPSVTGMVPLYAGRRKGLSMSIFNAGGSLGFALGPMFIAWYVSRYGLEATPWTMVGGLVALLSLWRLIPKPKSEGMRDFGFIGAIKESLGPAWKTVALIWLVMFLRAVTGQAFLTFIPVLFVKEGFSVVAVGAMYSIFTVAGVFSGLVAGLAADRFGYKPVLLFIFFVSTPALWLFLHLEAVFVYAGAFLAGGFILAAMPLGVSMAQIIAPKGRSMIASLMMGFAYGLGGFITPFVGKLADQYGIRPVLFAIACVPLLTLPIIACLPPVKSGD